jgi:outer membrane protein assembly factor BamB
MKCQEIREILDLCALGGLSDQARESVEEHLKGCVECRRQADEWNELVRGVRSSMQAIRASGGMSPDARARIDAEVAAARRAARWNRLTRFALRAAAVLVVGATLALVLHRWEPATGRIPAASVEWRQPGIAASTASHYPLVCGPRLIVLQQEGGSSFVTAVAKSTGRPLWRVPLPGVTTVQADDQRVYALSASRSGPAELVAFQGDDGRELWRHPSEDIARGAVPSRSSLLLADGGICWAQGSRIDFLRADTGATAWTRAVEGRDVALASGGLDMIFAAAGTVIQALRVRDGEPLWQQSIGKDSSPFLRPFLCSDGRQVYFARAAAGPDSRGELRCFAAQTGDPVWSAKTSMPLGLSVAGTKLYLRSRDLEVFETRSGARAWSASVVGCAPVASSDGRVYVVSGRGKQEIVALDAESGKTMWTNHLASSCSGVVVDADQGFICGHDGVLYAITIGRHG